MQGCNKLCNPGDTWSALTANFPKVKNVYQLDFGHFCQNCEQGEGRSDSGNHCPKYDYFFLVRMFLWKPMRKKQWPTFTILAMFSPRYTAGINLGLSWYFTNVSSQLCVSVCWQFLFLLSPSPEHWHLWLTRVRCKYFENKNRLCRENLWRSKPVQHNLHFQW